MFKQKNKKIIQCDSRITLDAKHNEIIKNFKEEQKNIKKYYLELKLEEENLDKNAEINSSIIQKIAEAFKVSTMVAIIRLRNLNYNVPYISYA